MQGIVTADREAILTVTVFDANGQGADVDTVLDTGFTDYLTLPQSTINALALSRKGVMQVILADGTEVDLAIFQGRVLWCGQTRAIDILAADGGPPPRHEPSLRLPPLHGYSRRCRVHA